MKSRLLRSQFSLLMILLLGAGCGGDPPPATDITITDTSLTFDPATCKLTKGTLGLGLGSATVEILQRDGGVCTFEFTHEVEGGYTVYRAEVPTDAGPVEIHEGPDGAEVTTSFDLSEATVVHTGNLHFE